MPDGASASLRERYATEIAARGFRSDPAQLRAVDRLEKLRRALLRAERAERGAAGALWQRLTGRRRGTPSPRGVYLWGGVGRGKTWMMDLFFQSLPLEHKRRYHFHRFMHEVHAELRDHRDTPDPLALVAARIAGRARVLCFDELFVSDIADAMLLGGLFRHLLDHGVALVITSNVPPRELYRDGLQRQRFMPAIELLEQQLDVLCVDGGVDYRLRQLTHAPIYLDSTDAESKEALARLFEQLADGRGAAAGSIEVEGRPIAVIRESENVVWFDFAAICEGPRSQSDYIEVAREYQSVIVSDVPVLTGTTDNAARRFVALVDEFYDRSVKLVISAAARPDALYRGERLRFEFTRTASRLIEMQSEEYLAREHRP
jgi:cell division protein ZapE